MDIGASPLTPYEEILQRVRIELAASQRTEIGIDWRYDFQSPFWRLYVNNRSGASIAHDQKTLLLKAGRVYVIPAWVRFQTMAGGPVIQDYLHFYVTGFPPSLLRQVFDRPFLLPPCDPTLEPLRSRWQEGFQSGPGFAELSWANALAYAAVATVMEGLSATEKATCLRSLSYSSQIGPALAAIDRSLSKPPVNAELAALCNLSTDHFIREFRHIIGMTPASYGIERRTAIAAQWLTAGERTIDEIAESAGFTDRFHFSRVFKARLGLPPAAYRKLHRSALGG